MVTMLKQLPFCTYEINSLHDVCVLRQLDALARHIDDAQDRARGARGVRDMVEDEMHKK